MPMVGTPEKNIIRGRLPQEKGASVCGDIAASDLYQDWETGWQAELCGMKKSPEWIRNVGMDIDEILRLKTSPDWSNYSVKGTERKRTGK